MIKPYCTSRLHFGFRMIKSFYKHNNRSLQTYGDFLIKATLSPSHLPILTTLNFDVAGANGIGMTIIIILLIPGQLRFVIPTTSLREFIPPKRRHDAPPPPPGLSHPRHNLCLYGLFIRLFILLDHLLILCFRGQVILRGRHDVVEILQ